MKAITSKTVLFVTGAFVHNSGWDQWKAYFEQQGFTTHNPAWPHKNAAPNVLRDLQPNDTALADLRLTAVIDSYAAFAKTLPEQPILVGHSLGGLIVQKLVERGIGVAGVLIHSVPPQSVFTLKFSFYKATWKPLGYLSSVHKTHLMSLKEWQYAFTNGMSLEDQKTSYALSVIPESRKVMRDGLTSAAKIDFKKPHVPLLFIAGTEDHIMPASLNHTNYKRYKKGNPGSVTDFKEFPGHNHYVVGMSDWKNTADYVLGWIAKQ